MVPSMSATPSSSVGSLARRAALWLFLALSGFFVLTGPDHIDVTDGVILFRLSQAMVDEGSLSFPPLDGITVGSGLTIPRAPDAEDGSPRWYSKYGIAPSLLMVPPYALSRLLLPLARDAELAVFHPPATVEGQYAWRSPQPTFWGDERSFRRLWYGTDRAHFELAFGAWMANCTAAITVAALCAAMLLFGARLGGSLRSGLVVALATAFASPFWSYAYQSWSEQLAALLLLGALYQVHRWGEDQRQLRLIGVGAMLGLLVATKTALASVGLAVGLAIWMRWRARSLGALARVVGGLGLGALPPIALVLAYNLARFGSPLQTGYGAESAMFNTPLLVGLAGLLFSPGRGLFLYFPLMLIGLAAMPALARRAPEIGVAAVVTLLTLLLLYARWWQWEGGWCWGPRFLLPALPLFILPLACLRWGALGRGARALVALLSLAGVLMAYNGVQVSYHDYYQWLKRMSLDHPELVAAAGADHYVELLRWSWSFAPAVAWWRFPVRETMLLPSAVIHPGLVLALLGLALVATLVGAIGVWRCVRVERG